LAKQNDHQVGQLPHLNLVIQELHKEQVMVFLLIQLHVRRIVKMIKGIGGSVI
jgi:hypothetical protein